MNMNAKRQILSLGTRVVIDGARTGVISGHCTYEHTNLGYIVKLDHGFYGMTYPRTFVRLMVVNADNVEVVS